MNLKGLSSLADLVPDNTPSNLEAVYYLFWTKGIGLEKVLEYPIPYIMSIMKTHGYMLKEEEKAIKKANKRKR